MTEKIKTRYTRTEVLNRIWEYVGDRAPIGDDGMCRWDLNGSRCVVGCLLESETIQELEIDGSLGMSTRDGLDPAQVRIVKDVTGVSEDSLRARQLLSGAQASHDSWTEDHIDEDGNWTIPINVVRTEYMKLLDGILEYRGE